MMPAVVDADILALDLDAIAYKLAVDDGWAMQEIDEVERQYRAFLHLVRHLPSFRFAPTRRQDAMWHHHILDTEKYARDCQQVFGRFVHHWPYSGLLGPSDAQAQEARFVESQRLLEEIVTATWPIAPITSQSEERNEDTHVLQYVA
jgi:hypothetical protein